MRLFFATSNPGKLVTPKRVFAEYGIELVAPDPALIAGMPEPQGESVAQVAIAKAWWAHERLRAPVMVADSSFVIDALNGFPGVYVKHVTESIGLDGYLRLLLPSERFPDRTCRFVDALVYTDGLWPEATFMREEVGTLADAPRGPKAKNQKSEMWKLFIPKGETKTIAELAESGELDRYRSGADQERHYRALASWLKDKRH